MTRHRKDAYRRIATVALVGLVLRSLVAPGLMVVDGADGFGGLSLVLCPGQNPGLNFDLLASSDDHHKHHHGGGRFDSDQLQSDPERYIGVHAESLDAGCALWVASASGTALAVYKLPINGTLQSEQPITHSVVCVRSTLHSNRQPRAPPIVT